MARPRARELERREAMKLREIEMAVCFDDGTWRDGFFVKIPADTPDGMIEETGRNTLISDQKWTGVGNIAHIFLYNSMDDECPDP